MIHEVSVAFTYSRPSHSSQFSPCCPAPAWSSSQKRWLQKRLSPSCSQWLLGTWWRVNLVLKAWKDWLWRDLFCSFHDFKYKTHWLTFIPGYILDLHLPHLCHVAQHSEDHEPRHKAGQTVHQTGHNGVTVKDEMKPCSRMCSMIIVIHVACKNSLKFSFLWPFWPLFNGFLYIFSSALCHIRTFLTSNHRHIATILMRNTEGCILCAH